MQRTARDRLVEYLRNLDDSLDRFDTLQLDAYGYRLVCYVPKIQRR